MVTVDVKNAFNSAEWTWIVRVMERKGIRPYLIELTKAYLSNRMLEIGNSAMLEVTCGVPQESVLGLTL